jgi:subtilase family serine protease
MPKRCARRGGRLEPATKLDLAIGLPVRNPAQLDYFLRDLYNPSSTNFHHYVKPTEFTDRFGPTTDDYQHVIDFLKSAGLTVTQTHPGRMLVEVTGTSTDVEKAFQVRLLTYQHPSENRRFYAPDREPSVPPDIRILDISGLDNYAPPKSLISKIVPLDASKASPAEWSGDGLQGTYIPEDFQAAYASGISANGAGQSVGLLEFDGCFPEDFVEYARQENLPRVNLKEVRVAGATGMPGEGSPEVQLDVEMAMGIAPGLSSIILYEAPLGQAQATYGNYFNSVLIRMVEDDAASQISSSWNPPSGPHLTTDQIFQQIAAQGQSFFQASGDYGAYTNKVPQRGRQPIRDNRRRD